MSRVLMSGFPLFHAPIFPGSNRGPVAEVADRGFYFLRDPLLEPREFFRSSRPANTVRATGWSGARDAWSAFSAFAIAAGSFETAARPTVNAATGTFARLSRCRFTNFPTSPTHPSHVHRPTDDDRVVARERCDGRHLRDICSVAGGLQFLSYRLRNLSGRSVLRCVGYEDVGHGFSLN